MKLVKFVTIQNNQTHKFENGPLSSNFNVLSKVQISLIDVHLVSND